VGTFGYMPPEQLDGRAVVGSDLFALGATLIFALSGLAPGLIEKENLSLNFRPYVQISEGLADWLQILTHPDFKQRFATAEDALEALYQRNTPKFVPATQAKKPWLAIAAASVLSLGLLFAMNPFLQSHFQAGGTSTVSGRIHDARATVKTLPVQQPRFWIRDQRTGKRIKAPVDYQQGQFQIRGLPAGDYGLNIAFDTNPQNPLQYPGDLRAWSEFEIKAGQAPPQLDLALIQLLHLTSPIDNNRPWSEWGQQCEGGAHLPAVPEFQWQSLGPGVVYDYQLSEESCSGSNTETPSKLLFSGSTAQTLLKLKLSPNQPQHYYKLRLEARQEGIKIARLRLHGPQDHDWDFKFKLP
jgi:serine/threonine protein kinase